MDLKALGRNTLIYAVGNIGLRAVAFLLIPLYAHLLSQPDFGMLYTIFFTMQIMLVLMNLGVRESLVRFASEAGRAGRMGTLLGSCLLVNLAGGALVTGAAMAFLLPFLGGLLHVENPGRYVLLASAITLAQVLTNQMLNYFRAINSALRFMAAGLCVAVALVIANVLLLGVFHMGIIGALVAQLIVYGLAFAVLAALILPRLGLGASRQVLRQVLAFGSPLVLSEFAWSVMIAVPAYFLSYHVGLAEVATYSLGVRLAQVVTIVLILPFQLAYAPYVFAHLDNAAIRQSMSRVLTYLVLAFGAVAFAVLTGSRFLVPLIVPAGYSGAVLVLLMMLPAVGFEALYAFSSTLLLIRRRSRVAGGLAVLAGGISLGLNLALVPAFGLYGAILVVNLATGFMALAVLIAGLRTYPLRLEVKRMTVGLAAFAGLGLLFLAAREASPPAFIAAVVLPGLAVPVLLYVSGFFDPSEKRGIRDVLGRKISFWRRPAARPALPSRLAQVLPSDRV
ncbi:MAG TPA: oligosaccharide flippase family protein [Planctomycetota bacterium]|nr:oligosaccharide flippase family protein [Planctomycetota bacterium]